MVDKAHSGENKASEKVKAMNGALYGLKCL